MYKYNSEILMKKRKKNNYNNNNKTEFKDIIQCQRVIPAEPNLMIKRDQPRMI